MDDPLIAARAIHFAASLVAGGTAVMAVLLRGPGLAAGYALRRAHIARLLAGALGLAVLSGLAWLFVVAANIGSEPWRAALQSGLVWTVLTGLRFGSVMQVRGALALALAVCAAIQWRGRPVPLWCGMFEAGLGLAFVVTLGFLGHAGAATGLDGHLHLANDMLHLIAASIWAGGLAPLLIAIWPSRAAPRLGSEDRLAILARFSNVALIAVTVLLASGLVNAWFMLPSPSDLIATTYGNLVLLKLCLFLIMVSAGALNRFRLMPALRNDPAGAPLRSLQISIAIELALACAVIGAVAILGQLSPPIR